jgi:hypothetical protein
MRTEMVGGTRSSTGAGSRPDRRAFLRVGAGCAMPLLAGGVLAARGSSRADEAAAPGPNVGQNGIDPVLAQIEQELARTYHAMRGPTGVRGEHVRTIAANLDLVGACLESSRAAARAEAAIRQRVAEHGRDATVRDGLAAHDRLLEDLALQHGVTPGRSPGAARLAAGLDRVAADGLRLQIRGHRARLYRLATEIDRAGAMRDAKPSPLLVRQKPGDDIGGYPAIPPGAGMTPCEFLEWLEAYLELVAVSMALAGLEVPAGITGLLAIVVHVLGIQPCKRDAEV